MARERAAARAARAFAAADRLREQVESLGFLVRDSPEGYTLEPAPPFPVLRGLADLPDRSAESATHRASVSVVVDGWPDDTRTCLTALLDHLPEDTVVQVLDVGDVDGAGRVAHDVLAGQPAGRVSEWHVASGSGWAATRTALLRADTSEVHVWCDLSTVLTGDALGPLLAPFADPGVVATGWRGVNVDTDADWREFRDAGPGEVDAVLGYLLAVRRSAALAVGGPDPQARFYRNADMEFCFLLREAGLGRVVVPPGELPVRQGRHHGYHDSDPQVRDRESRRTYDRFLRRFRGRTDLLAPR